MRLREYLNARGIRYQWFAGEIDVLPPALSAYLSGATLPPPAKMLKIRDLTAGEVQPNDFVEHVAEVRGSQAAAS